MMLCLCLLIDIIIYGNGKGPHMRPHLLIIFELVISTIFLMHFNAYIECSFHKTSNGNYDFTW